MSKVTIDTLSTLQNETTAVETIQTNFNRIQTAVENTLSRDGTTPNTMGAVLDMNSNGIMNLPSPTANSQPVTLGYLNTVLAAAAIPGYDISDVIQIDGTVGYRLQDYTATAGTPGVDATTAMQAALDAAKAAGGGVVYLTVGTYEISEITLANAPDITIYGEPGTVVKLIGTATQTPTGGWSATAMWFDNCDRLTIPGIKLDGNSKAVNGIVVTASDDVTIRDNEMYSCGANAILAGSGNTGMRIIRNRIRNSVGTSRGIWAGNTGATTRDTALWIADNSVSNTGGSAIIAVSSGGYILNNYITTITGAGIVLAGANSYPANNMVVANNRCIACTFHGIQADVTAPATLANRSYNVSIFGNICSGNTNAGIYVPGTYNWSVSNNICFDNVTGIQVEDYVDRITVNANLCFDTRSGGSRTQTGGITAVTTNHTATDLVFTNNILQNNTTLGLHVQCNSTSAIDGVVVSGNVSKSNGTYGIIFAEATAGNMTDVICSNNMTDGSTTDLYVGVQDVKGLPSNLYDSHTTAAWWDFTDADTTPSVTGREFYRAANTGATSITDFDDATTGQEITIYFANANTTLVHNGSVLILKGATNVNPAASTFMKLFYNGSAWIEVSRSF